MSRFIAVIHGWFVDSNGFDVVELKSSDKDSAYKEAIVLKHNRNSTFDKCAFALVEIQDSEILNRKLTLRERITGKMGSST